eukprot:239372-Amphidinium_carterae.1
MGRLQLPGPAGTMRPQSGFCPAAGIGNAHRGDKKRISKKNFLGMFQMFQSFGLTHFHHPTPLLPKDP